MIRIRIERGDSPREGLVWYEGGRPIGSVVIESGEDHEEFTYTGDVHMVKRWVPVQVIYNSPQNTAEIKKFINEQGRSR